jgi:filamentous hemagglutinin-like outer membrane protein
VNLYANGDISVNQSRVFTLEGGDLTVVSLNGNIDAGKGAKTVQAIQPPSVSYDGYGNISITPFGPSSGSGLAVLRALPDVPLGNADLIAINGFVDAGDAGIRVSGNLNIAALTVLNAGNIQVGGKSTGVPTVEAPNIAALTSASNTAGAAAKTSESPSDPAKSSDQPSVIIVEFLGFGGGDGEVPAEGEQARQRRDSSQIQDPHSRVQILGAGELTGTQRRDLVDEKRKLLSP